MKITIRTNPEIVIEVDSIAEDKKVLPAIAVPAEAKAGSDAKPELKERLKKEVRASGTARNAERRDTARIIAPAAEVAR
jgi:hypothetical protein